MNDKEWHCRCQRPLAGKCFQLVRLPVATDGFIMSRTRRLLCCLGQDVCGIIINVSWVTGRSLSSGKFISCPNHGNVFHQHVQTNKFSKVSHQLKLTSARIWIVRKPRRRRWRSHYMQMRQVCAAARCAAVKLFRWTLSPSHPLKLWKFNEN